MSPDSVLERWLTHRVPVQTSLWLQANAAKLRTGGSDKDLYMAVSLVPRKVGKADLAPTAAELGRQAAARPGWDPTEWSMDQAARIFLLLAAGADATMFARRLDQLCATADVGELVAFYRGLPLYPDQPRYVLRAAEGVRTNMKAVFEAVAHRNPYPAEQLPRAGVEPDGAEGVVRRQPAWIPIVGLDRRANPALARMLCDYAHERWSAARPVSPELWRCVGPFATRPDAGRSEARARQGHRT